MGRSPKNVQGERGGCKGAFIQTTVGTEAGDDRSDPHTFRILGDLRPEVECFPAGPPPPHRQGHCKARQTHSQLSDTCPVVPGILLLNHLFIMNKSHLSLASSTVCSHIVLLSWGLSDAKRLGDMLGTRSQAAEVPGGPGQRPHCEFPLEAGVTPCYTVTPQGNATRDVARSPCCGPGAPLYTTSRCTAADRLTLENLCSHFRKNRQGLRRAQQSLSLRWSRSLSPQRYFVGGGGSELGH